MRTPVCGLDTAPLVPLAPLVPEFPIGYGTKEVNPFAAPCPTGPGP
jgi:hypothetical protein